MVVLSLPAWEQFFLGLQIPAGLYGNGGSAAALMGEEGGENLCPYGLFWGYWISQAASAKRVLARGGKEQLVSIESNFCHPIKPGDSSEQG